MRIRTSTSPNSQYDTKSEVRLVATKANFYERLLIVEQRRYSLIQILSHARCACSCAEVNSSSPAATCAGFPLICKI